MYCNDYIIDFQLAKVISKYEKGQMRNMGRATYLHMSANFCGKGKKSISWISPDYRAVAYIVSQCNHEHSGIYTLGIFRKQILTARMNMGVSIYHLVSVVFFVPLIIISIPFHIKNCSIMITTRVEHISSTHSYGVHRFSLSADSCVTHTEN